MNKIIVNFFNHNRFFSFLTFSHTMAQNEQPTVSKQGAASPGNPRRWGPGLWTLMYTIAATYDPAEDDMMKLKIFFDSLKEALPCIECRDSYKSILEKYPFPIGIAKTNVDLFRWVYKLNVETQKHANRPMKETYESVGYKYGVITRAPQQKSRIANVEAEISNFEPFPKTVEHSKSIVTVTRSASARSMVRRPMPRPKPVVVHPQPNGRPRNLALGNQNPVKAHTPRTQIPNRTNRNVVSSSTSNQKLTPTNGPRGGVQRRFAALPVIRTGVILPQNRSRPVRRTPVPIKRRGCGRCGGR
jgi:hypothetical protein